jgi:Uri superfamily endonuclease
MYIPYGGKNKDSQHARKNCWLTNSAALNWHIDHILQRNIWIPQTYLVVAWLLWHAQWSRNMYKTIEAKPRKWMK